MADQIGECDWLSTTFPVVVESKILAGHPDHPLALAATNSEASWPLADGNCGRERQRVEMSASGQKLWMQSTSEWLWLRVDRYRGCEHQRVETIDPVSRFSSLLALLGPPRRPGNLSQTRAVKPHFPLQAC